jgi:hypothetical protein
VQSIFERLAAIGVECGDQTHGLPRPRSGGRQPALLVDSSACLAMVELRSRSAVSPRKATLVSEIATWQRGRNADRARKVAA